MKLIRTLEITKDEFYDYLESDLLSNILECTKKERSVQDIKKGLTYSKHDKDVHTKIDITILDYQRGKIYKAKVKSMADTITITYLTEQDGNGLKVTFEQNIQSFEAKKHRGPVKWFSEGIYFGRMSDTLYDIQKKIINKRNGVVEPEKSKPLEHKHLKSMVSKNR